MAKLKLLHALLLVPVGALLAGSGCSEDPLASFRDLTATSFASQGHSHEVTIPSGEIEEPPQQGRTYSTTADGSPSHRHELLMSAAQLADLQRQYAVVDVETNPLPPPLPDGLEQHTHTFVLQR